jgi:hypothetical protein
MRRLAIAVVVIGGAACAVHPPPAVVTSPLYPDFPALVVPAPLKPSPDIVQRHDEAWRRLQSGDLGGARRDYQAILARDPSFYPAAAGLGYVAIASHDYKEAAAQFGAAIQANGRYRPALDGRVDAAVAAGDDAAAIAALQAVLRVDPANDAARNRLDVVRFRQVQHEIDSARRSREAGRLDEAQATLDSALAAAPPGAVIFRELALVAMAKGDLAGAEGDARKAVQADASDAEAWAVLGAVLDKAARSREASEAYDKAFSLDPRPVWRDHRDALRTRADEEAEPKAFHDIASAPTVTRADVAAMIGLRLPDVLSRSPRHVTVVATDARGNWAATWILQVTQAGVMDVFSNHTFQPESLVKRGTLAEVVSRLLTALSSERGTDLSRWKAMTPAFADVPSGSPAYGAAALAVAAGAMTAVDGRFGSTQPATGADLVAAIARLQQLAR